MLQNRQFLLRKEYLKTKCIAFGLPGDLLSIIQDEIDFDAESERILEEIKNTDKNRFFEYRENQFLEVNYPKWFKP